MAQKYCIEQCMCCISKEPWIKKKGFDNLSLKQVDMAIEGLLKINPQLILRIAKQ